MLMIPPLARLSYSVIRMEKEMLVENVYIGQVENKFLVSECSGMLMLWDQHAVHERIR